MAFLRYAIAFLQHDAHAASGLLHPASLGRTRENADEDANQQTTERDSPWTLKKSRIPDEREDLSRIPGLWKDECRIVSREWANEIRMRDKPRIATGQERSLSGLSSKGGRTQDDVENRAD
jgi:hypothetical protein